MEKPIGYDSSESKNFEGGFPTVEPGAYVLGIVKAECGNSKGSGSPMLTLSLDIAQGEHKGFYRRLSEKLNKDVLLKKYIVYGTEASTPYFKGAITSIEKSNPGFIFNFDENSLRGKIVGGMLGEEEYENKNGEIKASLKVAFICNIAKVNSGTLTIPEKKTLFTSNNNSVNNEAAPAHNDDDLPF